MEGQQQEDDAGDVLTHIHTHYWQRMLPPSVIFENDFSISKKNLESGKSMMEV